jgi:hypothetical protein
MAEIVELPVFADANMGSLGVVETGKEIGFDIARVFYHFGLPDGAIRGGHAHRGLKQFVICLSGAIEVAVEDVSGQRRFLLRSPSTGLMVPPLNWLVLNSVSEGSTSIVLCSDSYEKSDYIRDLAEFRQMIADLDQGEFGVSD